MSELTAEEIQSKKYAYELLKLLQRYFRCSDSGYRMYLYNFYSELFDRPDVIITKGVYDRFISQMERDSIYYGEKGLYNLEDIYYDSGYAESKELLTESFRAIGIEMVINSNNITFTMPDGTQKIIASANFSNSYLCSRTGCEYTYARKMMPYFDLQHLPPTRIDEVDSNVSGYGTFWEHDGVSTLEISGEGSLASYTLFAASGLNIYSTINTIILGAGVNKLMTNSLNYTKDMTIVSLRGANQPIEFEANFSGTTTSEYNWTIYTDNVSFKNAQFATGLKITFKSLSEWQG